MVKPRIMQILWSMHAILRAMLVLGFESSCDETGVALYDSERGLLAHALYSQVAMHAEYGGVVPELASRDHIRKLTPLLEQVLSEAGVTSAAVDAVAYTAGPGLVGALLTGAAYARSLAFAWGVPALPVHHMEGHLLAPMLEPSPPEFPFVALLVSGGHTLLVDVQGLGRYTLLGESLDDAVGEAFDKTAKLLELGYPGGPAIQQLAEQLPDGDVSLFKFSRPMTDRPGLDFSFSGLKTQVITHVNKFREQNKIAAAEELPEKVKVHVAAAFQDAVVDTLRIKCQRALQQTGGNQLVVAGGVGANTALRQALSALPDVHVYFPAMAFCTDNGAMIAYAGYRRLQTMRVSDGVEAQQAYSALSEDLTIQARPRWPLAELSG